MKLITLSLYATFASALNTSTYQETTNTTQIRTLNQWPDLPLVVRVPSGSQEDFGTIEFEIIVGDLTQQEAIVFSHFSDKLVNHLRDHNDRFTAVSMAQDDRPLQAVVLKVIPYDDVIDAPKHYFSSLLQTMTQGMRSYGFKEIHATAVAPSFDTRTDISLIMEEDPPFDQWTVPTYINVLPTSDYIVKVGKILHSFGRLPGLSGKLNRGIKALLDRAPAAAFTTLSFQFEIEARRFTVKVAPYQRRSWPRPLSNLDAFHALLNWSKWFAYEIKICQGAVDLHVFEIVDVVPYSPASATSAMVAKGEFFWEPISVAGNTTRGNNITDAPPEKQSGRNTTVEVFS